LLSKRNVRYASTCQTVGMTIVSRIELTRSFSHRLGIFSVIHHISSFELRRFLVCGARRGCFVSLFSNQWLRSTPSNVGMLEIGPLMRFWAIIYVLVTIWLVFFKTEVWT
jgi:hypothetical protein